MMDKWQQLFKNPHKLLLFSLVLITLSFLFYFRLGSFSLQSYDEAWYAAIARNLNNTGNPFILIYNNQRFVDHPPLGFILISLSSLVFGENEFGFRFAVATSGIGVVILVYLIGTNIANRLVGIAASTSLLSSLWFMLRARSANLDVLLLLFLVLSVYALIKTHTNKQYLYLATVALAAAFLTKTSVALALLPAFTWVAYSARRQLKFAFLLKNLMLFIAIALPWYSYQILTVPDFFQTTIRIISRGDDASQLSLQTVSRSMNYMQIAMGRLAKLSLVGFAVSVFYLFRHRNRKDLLTVCLSLAGFAPLVLSNKVEIWHLLPLVPFLCILLAFGFYQLGQITAKKFVPVSVFLLFILMSLAVYQFKQSWNLMYPVEGYNNQKDIALAAKKYKQVYLCGTYFPATVYYSQATVVPVTLGGVSCSDYLTDRFLSQPQQDSVAIISHQEVLELNPSSLNIIYQNDGYLLVQSTMSAALDK